MTARPGATDHNSSALYQRASRSLVGGVNSPVRSFSAVGGDPLFVERAHGPLIWDVDGREYIDLVGSWGAAIVGHAHPAVVAAVSEAASKGLSFGACCSSEAELAELILDGLPSCELVRFVSSGTEAVMSVLRLARAVTGRDKIIKFQGCYHGHTDGLLVAAGSGAATAGIPDSAGVPAHVAQDTYVAEYNDAGSVEATLRGHTAEIAAVIVEPVAGNMGMVLPEQGFLARLRELCDDHGALLIFDEVMTGFRVSWGGFQTMCGVQPDLTCLGKVIGGGMPVAAYAGPARFMSMVSPLGPVYQAGTLSGNPVGMAAGLATLRLCRASGFYERLHATSTRLSEGLRSAAQSAGVALCADALGGMLGVFFSQGPVRTFRQASACDQGQFRRFFHAMLERGVWLPPSPYEAWFVSASHEEAHIDRVLAAAAESFRSLRT